MWNEKNAPALSLRSPLEEVLRFLFASSISHILLYNEKDRFFISKEELITFMEGGNGFSKIGDLLNSPGKNRGASQLLEKLPPFQKILFLAEEGGRILRVIDVTQEKELFFPPWWTAPFPLFSFQGEKIYRNEKAREICDVPDEDLQKHLSNLSCGKEDYIFSCVTSSGEERRFFAKEIAERIFVLEDVSNEMHMAQDIVWWAAVGNALTTYLQAKGVDIRFSYEREGLPEGQIETDETIPCRWDGDLLGYIKLSFGGNS